MNFVSGDKDFLAADADGDNKISRQEWIQMFGSDTGFDEADVDGDGQVNVEEWKQKQEEDCEVQGMQAQFLEQIDLQSSTDSSGEETEDTDGTDDEIEEEADARDPEPHFSDEELESLVSKYFGRFDLSGDDELVSTEDMEMLTTIILCRLEVRVSPATLHTHVQQLQNPPSPHQPWSEAEFYSWVFKFTKEK